MEKEEQAELEFLRWFFKSDFGLSNEEEVLIMELQYVEETGKIVPEGYRLADD